MKLPRTGRVGLPIQIIQELIDLSWVVLPIFSLLKVDGAWTIVSKVFHLHD